MSEEKANDMQVGGDHYKTDGEQHWDRAWRLEYDSFQYIITKWVERWRKKGGIEDLKKARHAIDKYIELAELEEVSRQSAKAGVLSRSTMVRQTHPACPSCGSIVEDHAQTCELVPGKDYVDQ